MKPEDRVAMLASQQPAARQITINSEGEISDADPVFMAELDGTAYERQGEGTCSASVNQEGSPLAKHWEPASFLSGVIGADEAGSDTLNGVAVNHYTFDERALGQLDIASSTGEVWVASDGDYLVKYVLATEAGEEYFGEGKEGTLTWDYEVTSVNQPVAIELPEDCPAGMVNAPLLPDAADVLNMPGLIGYTTAASVADAAAFYQEKLPALGWQLLGEPGLAEASAQLNYTQGDQQLSVIISTTEGVTSVHVVLTSVSPEAMTIP